jgi:hypothetical protein
MGVVIKETDDGTKQKVMSFLSDASVELPQKVADILNDIWNRILMDAIDFSSKTMDTGALASSINVIQGGLVAGGGLGQERSSRKPVSNWIFDRTIVAGDETIINPLTGKSTAMYAEWVHDGHIMRDGIFWEGNPFLTDALAAHEDELNAAVDRAMKELGLSGSD